jgi:hypothetical protein
MKEGSRNSISLRGGSLRGTWRKGSFTGNPERYVKEIYQETRKNSL